MLAVSFVLASLCTLALGKPLARTTLQVHESRDSLEHSLGLLQGQSKPAPNGKGEHDLGVRRVSRPGSDSSQAIPASPSRPASRRAELRLKEIDMQHTDKAIDACVTVRG